MAAADEQDLLAFLADLGDGDDPVDAADPDDAQEATASLEAPGRPKSDVFCRQQRTTRARDSFWDPNIKGSIFFFEYCVRQYEKIEFPCSRSTEVSTGNTVPRYCASRVYFWVALWGEPGRTSEEYRLDT